MLDELSVYRVPRRQVPSVLPVGLEPTSLSTAAFEATTFTISPREPLLKGEREIMSLRLGGQAYHLISYPRTTAFPLRCQFLAAKPSPHPLGGWHPDSCVLYMPRLPTHTHSVTLRSYAYERCERSGYRSLRNLRVKEMCVPAPRPRLFRTRYTNCTKLNTQCLAAPVRSLVRYASFALSGKEGRQI